VIDAIRRARNSFSVSRQFFEDQARSLVSFWAVLYSVFICEFYI